MKLDMRRSDLLLVLIVAAVVTLIALLPMARASGGGQRVNYYHVKSVTIKVDRPSRTLSGKVIADSADAHFCTSSDDWPVNIYRARRGPDDKVAHTRTNFMAEWHFQVRSDSLKGKRVYAKVPSFHNQANGFCVGASSRTVNAP